MMDSRLLDFDPVTKARRVLHMDGDLIHAVNTMDVGPRMEANAEIRKENIPMGEAYRAASIPTPIWEDLVRKGIANDRKRLRAWLNDPDNRAWRTTNTRV